MSFLLIVIFALGIVAGIVKSRYDNHTTFIVSPRPSPNNKLDMVDNMVLYGEVSGDDFYKGSG